MGLYISKICTERVVDFDISAISGNICDDPKCGGKLRDTIINFGESLPEGQID